MAQFRNDPGDVSQGALVYFDEAQSLVAVAVQQRVNQGRLARAPRPPQQRVVRRVPCNELRGIGFYAFLLQIYLEQVIQFYVVQVIEGDEPIPAAPDRRGSLRPVDGLRRG